MRVGNRLKGRDGAIRPMETEKARDGGVEGGQDGWKGKKREG